MTAPGFRLDSRRALVTGSASGLGKAIALALAGAGAEVVGADTAEEANRQVAGTVGGTAVTLDVSDRQSVQAAVEDVSTRLGPIDVLVNSAGIVDRTGLESMDEDVLDEMWAVNVKGPLRLTRLALPHLRRSGSGRVVNLASLSAKRVKGDAIPGYSMTKYALLALSHAVRQIGWDDGIRVTAICPGPVATDMMDPDDETITQPEDVADLVSTVIGLPNTASVSELLITCRLEAWA